jgi:hypothetical protein
MTPDRAKRILDICDTTEYELAIKEFPTLLLLLAAEVADLSKEWESIAESRKPEDVIRRGVICSATYDLCLHAMQEARAALRLNKANAVELPGIAHDTYLGASGDNPNGYTPMPPDFLDSDDMPHLEPEGE